MTLQTLNRHFNTVVRNILKLFFRNEYVNEKLLLFFFRQVSYYYTKRLLQVHSEVLGGQYKGLKLPKSILNHQNFTYVQVVGAYEAFLQDVIDEKIKGYKKFIDIGCGCGYYTNGISYKYNIEALGVDLEAKQIRAADQIAAENNLKNITHVAEKKGYDAFKYIEDGAFHLLDIEGGEYPIMEAMDPADYKNAYFLIEVHQFGKQTMEEGRAKVDATFSKTHNVTHITENIGRQTMEDGVYEALRDTPIPRQFSYMLLTEPRDYYVTWALVEPKK